VGDTTPPAHRECVAEATAPEDVSDNPPHPRSRAHRQPGRTVLAYFAMVSAVFAPSSFAQNDGEQILSIDHYVPHTSTAIGLDVTGYGFSTRPAPMDDPCNLHQISRGLAWARASRSPLCPRPRAEASPMIARAIVSPGAS
jgi:hypothetical protein